MAAAEGPVCSGSHFAEVARSERNENMAEKDQDVCDCELLESPPVVITQHCLLLLYVVYIWPS